MTPSPVPDGGYDGDDEEEEKEYPKEFRLENIEHFYSSQGAARTIRVNGISRGIVYLSDEEFDWLKQRIDGRMERGQDA